MKIETRMKIRECRKLFRATILSPTTDKESTFSRIANTLTSIQDDCHLAQYRVNQLNSKINEQINRL